MSDRRVPLGGGTSALVHHEPHAVFWDLIADGRFEPAVRAAVVELVRPGTTFVDIGAWVGCYALLGAALGAHVVAYEPDPVALVELQGNLALNPSARGTVTVRPVAVAHRGGPVAFTGGAHGLGQSVSHLARRSGGRADPGRVSVVAVDAYEVGADPLVRAAALVKIDIEGAEYAVVPRLVAGFAGARPPLLVSLHGFELRAWAEGHGRTVKLPVARLVAALRKARLLWSLRRYRLSLLDGEGASAPLSGGALVAFCGRLAEADVLALAR